ncbi:MAG: carbohydrate kinase family protein [Jiangellaceae bacterium]
MLLWDRADLGLAKELLDRGPREVLLKQGSGGAVLVDADGPTEVPAFAVPVVDTVGAGDAFAAGYLTAELWGLDAEARLRTAAALGAYAAMTLGDYEGPPDRAELDHFLTQEGRDLR